MKEQNFFFFFFKTFFLLHNSPQLTSSEQNLVDYDLMHFLLRMIYIHILHMHYFGVYACGCLTCINRLLGRFQETNIAELRSQFKRALVALLRKAFSCYQHRLCSMQHYRYILWNFQYVSNPTRAFVSCDDDTLSRPWNGSIIDCSNVVKFCSAIKRRL